MNLHDFIFKHRFGKGFLTNFVGTSGLDIKYIGNVNDFQVFETRDGNLYWTRFPNSNWDSFVIKVGGLESQRCYRVQVDSTSVVHLVKDLGVKK